MLRRSVHVCAVGSATAPCRPALSCSHFPHPISYVSCPPPSPFVPRRCVQTLAGQLRSGMIIDHEGRMSRVQSHDLHMRGRAHTTITLELRDVASGKSSSIRVRPSDKVELVQLESEPLTFLYKDATTLHLMHPDTFEPVELPVDIVDANQLPFLADNTSLRCTRRGSQWLGIELPTKVKARVVRAEGRTSGTNKGARMGGAERRALLDNGVWVEDVPNAVNPGDEIVVNTETLTFVSRV